MWKKQNITITTVPFTLLGMLELIIGYKRQTTIMGFVTKIGGWHTIDELKNSYGEMSTEFIINTIENKM